ncbi:DegT/DnrJ/EryC1/StrS family aminotransferase [Flintibacter muris]|uniref:DegT/DnrJ/EryC1/StrS family aminotransferase n=1 Tax=Flintibacter muris TaxID=2941327 RepID=UPI00203B6E81|nr:DegT/DnrJ/EryC1/StrS family aminotransferase [Flintibacter muris]
METINVTRSSMPPFEEYCEEIKELWDSRWLTNVGAKHRQLQEKLTEYLDAPHMDILTNGHLSLELSLQALELEGEVITTPFTFASTTQAIVRNGLTPVFCDVDPITLTLDPAKIEPLITERTCAIVPVHVYGNFCDVEAIGEIARKHSLKVLYDAAHAFGARYRDRGAGAYGDVSCFSFHATKVFHTLEGGGSCFQDGAFGKRLARLKNFGLNDPETATAWGGNAKLDEFRAAMGLCNLRHVEEEIEKRGRAEARYREHLEGVPGLRLKAVQPEVQPNHIYFPVLFDEEVFGVSRDRVRDALGEQGISARKYFYPLTSTFPCYQGRFDPGITPIALEASRQVLCLPMYGELSGETVDRICDVILNCPKRGGAP